MFLGRASVNMNIDEAHNWVAFAEDLLRLCVYVVPIDLVCSLLVSLLAFIRCFGDFWLECVYGHLKVTFNILYL